MSYYEITVPYFVKMLRNLNHILDKGVKHAEAKKFEMDVLLNARLAPDQFNLIRQVQIACDTAKIGTSRLSGKEAPSHDDKEKTLGDLKTRIDQTIGFLNSLTAADFEAAPTRKITTPRWDGKYLTGAEYVHHHMLPNFYFHVVTAYSILRHNGVEIGKADYLGEQPYKK